MNPKIEDLRKKAFLLYGGPHGPDLINKQLKGMGVSEDGLSEEQLKTVLNAIIKSVFVDYVGFEKAKEILAKDVAHVAGYHMKVQAEEEHVRIFERIHILPWLVLLMAAIIAVFFGAFIYYTASFDVKDFCKGKAEGPDRDSCFLSLALKNANVSFCDELSTTGKTYACYGGVGVKLNDTRICRMIPDNQPDVIPLHDKCIMCVAYRMRNQSICKYFTNPMTEAECEQQVTRTLTLAC
jgi:hypothetical protein